MNKRVYDEIIKTNEVMPCPLCGQGVIVRHNTYYDKWTIECLGCQLTCGSWGSKGAMLGTWNRRGKEITKKWKITGNDLPPFYLYANSFDEALRLARIINPNYNTGQIVEEDDLI